VTRQQAAEYLNLSLDIIDRLDQHGELRRGGVVRFHRERLELWLERQEPRSARQVTQGSRKMADPAA
jgi:excisionase family DNA binding protein